MDKSPTQRELVDRAQGGDREALDALIGMHTDRLRAWIERRVGAQLRAKTEVDDLLQETCLWVTRSIARFRWQSEASFYNWLCGIAHHMILKAAKTGADVASLHVGQEGAADSAGSPSRTLAREERFDRLAKALEGLSPEHQQVVRLARIEGLPVKEIAARLGRSPGAVSQLLARALRKLKEDFGETDSLSLPRKTLGPAPEDHGRE